MVDNSTRPLAGRQYLFLLSSGVYGYQSANHILQVSGVADVQPPKLGEEEIFVIYRMYPYQNGFLERSTYSYEEVKSDLQKVHQLIHN